MLVLVFKRDQSYRGFYLQINWLNRRWICGGPIENIIIHVGLYKRIKEIEETFLIDKNIKNIKNGCIQRPLQLSMKMEVMLHLVEEKGREVFSHCSL